MSFSTETEALESRCYWLQIGYEAASRRADNAAGRCDAALKLLREAMMELGGSGECRPELAARAMAVLEPGDRRSQWEERIEHLVRAVRHGRHFANIVAGNEKMGRQGRGFARTYLRETEDVVAESPPGGEAGGK